MHKKIQHNAGLILEATTIIKILINIDILIYYKIIVSNKVSNKKRAS